jgi:hypothetical protein
MKTLITKLKTYNLKTTRGFAVFFTVLISSIVLAIALGITSTSYQETVLASSAKEGNISFFAADTGVECALYWDSLGYFDGDPGMQQIDCAGISSFPMVYAGYPAIFDLLLGTNSCSKITVEKNVPIDPADSSIMGTKIQSLGYNVSCTAVNNQASQPNPRIVERSIQVTYGYNAIAPYCGDAICNGAEDVTSCPQDCSGGGGGGGGGGPDNNSAE